MKAKTWPSRFCIFFLLTNFLLRLYAALSPLACIDSIPLPDDAYISLGLARNIAHGLGPYFGGGFTNGFQPLYVFLMVPVYWLFPRDLFTPVHLSLVLLAIFDTMALYLLLRLLEKLKKSILTIALVAASWALNPYRMQIALDGLETVIAFFFIVVSFSYYLRMRNSAKEPVRRRSYFIMGIILGLAALARIDNLLLAFVIAMALFLRQLKNKLPWRDQFKNLSSLAMGGMIMYLPWLLYSFYYSGQIFPVSGKAVRLLSQGNILHRAPYIKEALSEMFFNNFLLIALGILFLIVLFLMPKRLPKKNMQLLLGRIKNYNVLSVFCLLLTLAYVFYFFGYWAFFRYLYPVSLLLVVFFAEAIDLFIENIMKPRRKVLFVFLIMLPFLLEIVAASHFDNFFAAQKCRNLLFRAQKNKNLGYMNLGLWARDHFASGVVVGSGQSGALEYYAGNLKIINLDGVVNHSCYQALRQKRFMEYAREIGLQYILAWDSEIRFFKRFSTNFRESELIFVKKINEFGFQNKKHWLVYQLNRKLPAE